MSTNPKWDKRTAGLFATLALLAVGVGLLGVAALAVVAVVVGKILGL